MYLKPNSPAVGHHGKTVIGFNWIGGKEAEGDLPSFDARSAVDSRDTVGIFPECGERDVDRAARAAAAALAAWGAAPARERGAAVGRIGEVLAARQESVAAVITREVGRPPREALDEVREIVALCRAWADPARFQAAAERRTRPLGVCAVLAGGAAPLAAPAWKVLGALVCGGTVVWKPSVHAPTTAYLLVRCMMDAGLAPGVVNVVNGRGRGECGRAMLAGIARGLFQKVCFSGSQTAGRVVAEQAGRALVPVSLELGGRSPMLVMPDADLGRAVAEALRAAFRGAGQGRAALGNILVHRDVALPFREAFLAGVQALTSGNPVTDPEVACGPMINPRCARVFIDHFSRGREDGARLLCGGDAWSEDNRTPQVRGAIAKGSYMQPCVWDEVTPEMEIFRAELPGPTVNLSPVDSFDQALAWANACPHAAVATLLSGSAGWIARFRRDCNAAALRVNAGEDGWSGSGDSERSPGWETGYTRWQEASGAPLPEPAAGPGMERGAYEATNWDGLEGGARQLQ